MSIGEREMQFHKRGQSQRGILLKTQQMAFYRYWATGSWLDGKPTACAYDNVTDIVLSNRNQLDWTHMLVVQLVITDGFKLESLSHVVGSASFTFRSLHSHHNRLETAASTLAWGQT